MALFYRIEEVVMKVFSYSTPLCYKFNGLNFLFFTQYVYRRLIQLVYPVNNLFKKKLR